MVDGWERVALTACLVWGCAGGAPSDLDAGPGDLLGDASMEDVSVEDVSVEDAFVEDAFVVEDAPLTDAFDDAFVEEPDPPEEEPAPEPETPDPDPAARVVQTTYRVLHWNVAGGKEHGCHVPQVARAVVRFVRERNIDFVGLNEVCPAQYREIRDRLRMLWGKTRVFSSFVGSGELRNVGVAIFSRFDLTPSDPIAIGSDRYGMRNLLCGRLRARPHLRFCATHLSPSPSLARPQLERVMRRLENWWANQRDTVILAGDFNLEPRDRAFNAVYSSAANHAANNPDNRGRYRELDDADRAHCLGYGERSVPRLGGGPCRDGRRIDLIFARENRIVGDRYWSDTLNVPTDCDGNCSDHRPVIGQVRVRVRLD